jgi:cyclopropane fatty-acyl-phospholipid synthase-like methyltransferase
MVTGIDISDEQVRQAEENIPQAVFIRDDVLVREFQESCFDGVVSFYALGHIPRQQLPELLANIHRWLRKNGQVVLSFATGNYPDHIDRDFLGAQMFFSSYDALTNRKLLQQAGFEILYDKVETEEEFGQSISFHWVKAKRI